MLRCHIFPLNKQQTWISIKSSFIFICRAFVACSIVVRSVFVSLWAKMFLIKASICIIYIFVHRNKVARGIAQNLCEHTKKRVSLSDKRFSVWTRDAGIRQVRATLEVGVQCYILTIFRLHSFSLLSYK